MMSPKRYHRHLIKYGERLERARKSRSPLLHCEVQRQWKACEAKPLTERRQRREDEVGWYALELEQV